jgi:hypothetical protein
MPVVKFAQVSQYLVAVGHQALVRHGMESFSVNTLRMFCKRSLLIGICMVVNMGQLIEHIFRLGQRQTPEKQRK